MNSTLNFIRSHAFTLAIWSTFAWAEKFNNGLCTHFSQLRGLKSSRYSSHLVNRRCEWSFNVLLPYTDGKYVYTFMGVDVQL